MCTMSTSFPLSSSSVHWSIVRSNCKVVERPGMKPLCLLYMMLFDFKNSSICFRVIFSAILLHIDVKLMVCSFSIHFCFLFCGYQICSHISHQPEFFSGPMRSGSLHSVSKRFHSVFHKESVGVSSQDP